jgi:hypothetical protein
VGAKIDAGGRLTPVEEGILLNGITRSAVALIPQHPALLD